MSRSVLSMQRGVLSRLIGRVARAAFIPVAHRRVSVVLNHLRDCSKTANTMSYCAVERGQPNTLDYRIYFKGPNGQFVSPFHDIPLEAKAGSNVFNMVVEIPRWSNAKMEISTGDKLNPIKQDVKKGKLRYVKNIFPHHGYIWNYGAFPQTWEDPKHKFEETDTAGDNDPLDVCEIGTKIAGRGEVIQVKVLGTLLLIDEGETDWKIMAIDVTDPMADKLNDIEDIDREMPGFLTATYEWFRYYKKPDGKPENSVHWGGKCKGRDYALEVVQDAHKDWKKLMADPPSGNGVCCVNTKVSGCPDTISPEAAASIIEQSPPLGAPDAVDQDVNKWYYVIPQ